MKKRVYLFVSLILTSLIVPNFVSAQGFFENLGRGFGSGLAGGISGFIQGIYEGIGLGTQNLTLVLFGILLWMIVYSVVKKMHMFQDPTLGKLLSIGVSIIITTLMILGLPEGFVDGLLVQYGAAGAAMLSVIPFVLIFYFTVWVSDSLLFAKLTWIFYIFYYFGMLIFAAAGGNIILQQGDNTFWPYIVAILAGIVGFAMMGFMRKRLYRETLEAMKERGERRNQKAKLGIDLASQYADLNSGG